MTGRAVKVNLQALILMLSISLKNVKNLDFSTNHFVLLTGDQPFIKNYVMVNFNDEAISLIEAIYN